MLDHGSFDGGVDFAQDLKMQLTLHKKGEALYREWQQAIQDEILVNVVGGIVYRDWQVMVVVETMYRDWQERVQEKRRYQE